ncbi:MAG: VOC family protein, partial [Planctomycetota bacterium]
VAFYERAFGWNFTEYGPAYLGIQKPGGGEFGGLCTVCKVPTGGPLVILYSEDLEATSASVTDSGGSIVKETFTFPGGPALSLQGSSG